MEIDFEKNKFIEEYKKIKQNLEFNLDYEFDENKTFLNLIEYGDINDIKFLLEKRHNIDITYQKYCAFYYSIHKKDLDLLKFLCSLIPNIEKIEICDYFGETIFLFENLMICACVNNDIEICKWLYEKNSYIRFTIGIDSAVYAAFTTGNIELVEWIYSKDQYFGTEFDIEKILNSMINIYKHKELSEWLINIY